MRIRSRGIRRHPPFSTAAQEIKPPENLGHRAGPDDADFADAKLVENVYDRVSNWLSGEGRGAQAIFVDYSPPTEVTKSVVVRFSRDRAAPPFGLIDDADE
jgi:hypothetical protein